MSEPKRDDEPTMEEILASIRKIISEDEPDGAEAAPGEAVGAEAGQEPEPMELTQMVSEDGSVVDLRSDQSAEAVSADEAAQNGAATEPLVPENTPVHADLVGADDGIELEAAAPADPEPEILAEPDPEPEPDIVAEPEIVAEPDPEPEIVAEPDPEPEIVAEPDPEPDVVAEPEPVAAAAAEAPQATADGTDGPLESLVSEQAAAAATAAMTRLNDSLSTDSAPASGSDKTLEALVRETLTPYLKTWLDENLPRLVERIVREEVDRIARRADFR